MSTDLCVPGLQWVSKVQSVAVYVLHSLTEAISVLLWLYVVLAVWNTVAETVLLYI